MRDLVLLGAVTGAHGIKGEVKVKTFTSVPEDLAAYGALATKTGRVLKIASLRPARPGELLVIFAGVADRNAAEKLKGEGLYVGRAQLPPPQPGEYYQADLVGLQVRDAEGKSLGEVRGVHNFGAGDMLEIVFADGATEFVPLTDDYVPLVDIAAGHIVLAPVEAGEDEKEDEQEAD